MNQHFVKDKTFYVLRWIGFLPAAIVGSIIVFWILTVGNEITMSPFVSPDSFMGRLFLLSVPNVACGAAFVYVGVLTAPASKRLLSLVMGGLTLLGAGVSFSGAIMARDWWGVYGIAWMVVGGIVCAYELFKYQNEIEIASRGA